MKQIAILLFTFSVFGVERKVDSSASRVSKENKEEEGIEISAVAVKVAIEVERKEGTGKSSEMEVGFSAAALEVENGNREKMR